jgi:CubicO group peptidase (beta-lactamase class C family)
MLANGGELDGVRILSPERIAVATEIQSFEWDEVYHVRVRRALGYRRAQDCGPLAGPSAFGHVGGGGSYGYADPEHKFAIGMAKNYFTYNTGGGGPPQRRVGLAVAEAVTSALGGW